MSKPGKRSRAAAEGIDPVKFYPLDEAVKVIKDRAKAKFDETVEVAMNLGVDPRIRIRWCAAYACCRTARAARHA
jgi:large subunit ribosomal protein L1